VGTFSMDSFVGELDRELPVGSPVVLVGHGILAEAHARVAGTINYELVSGIETGPLRARRTIIDA
jgi:alanine racemase